MSTTGSTSRRRTTVGQALAWFLVASLCLLAGVGLGTRVLAQLGAGDWVEPVNVSHSGTASDPALVVLPGGMVRVLWWDEFEGLMVSQGQAPGGLQAAEAAADGTGWSDPAAAPILFPTVTRQAGQAVTVQTPIHLMPHVVGDAVGQAHAFWMGEVSVETGQQPLHYSRLAPGEISWTRPVTLVVQAGAFDVATDLSGTMHLAYVRPTSSADAPNGLYYRRFNESTRWSDATIIQPSRYLRLLPSGIGALHVTAEDANRLRVTWQDPRTGQDLIVESSDAGATWQGPRLLVAGDGVPQDHRALGVPNQPERLLWPLPGQPGSRMTVSSREDAVALARWDGEHWTATHYLDLDLNDPDTGQALYLGAPRLALVSVPGEGGARETLVVVGIDRRGDLWITGIAAEVLSSRLESALEYATENEAADQGAGVSLSKSGSASGPALLAGLDNRLYAFWWDRFDGLLAAQGAITASRVTSGTEEVVTSHSAWSEPWPVPLAAAATPWLLADGQGGIHALWLAAPEPPATQEEARRLQYSRWALDGTAWSAPVALAEAVLTYDVVADAAGTLHLAYLLGQPAPGFPVGVYYRATGQPGEGWGPPILVHRSDYMRLATAGDSHVRLAVADTGDIYVTWDEPRSGRALLAYSLDGGRTWPAPVTLGEQEGASERGRLVSLRGGEVLALWEHGQASTTACHLVQAPVSAVLDGSAGDGQPVLAGLANCSGNERFYALAGGRVLMVAGMGSATGTLALWDGESWSEPALWAPSFESVETGRSISLGAWQVALVQGTTDEGTGDVLVAIGTDDAQDVWVLHSQVDNLGLTLASPSPWSAPVGISEDGGYPDLPAMAVDAESELHALWSQVASPGEWETALSYARWDGTQWTRSTAVLNVAGGQASEPSLVAVGDRLHAVWSGGQSGEILYSYAFAGDASAASSWSEPVVLPAPSEVGSRPDIVAGADGSLHVVYAVPVNESRGIYYTRSDNGGESWLPAHQLFDGAAAGWVVVDAPQVAVDAAGLIHVVWVRGTQPGSSVAQGVYYAGSLDGGQTWSAPLEMAAGIPDGPQVVTGTAGHVHIVWHASDGQSGWWHRWSLDAGQTWTRQERIAGLEAASAPAALLEDGTGALYWAGLRVEDDGGPALMLSTWDGQRWGVPEVISLDLEALEAGVTASLQPDLGEIQVLVRGEIEPGDRMARIGVWHTGRQLPPVSVTVMPAVAPVLTATPVAVAEPTATAQPTASFGTTPPAMDSSSPSMPMLVAGVLAGLIVVGGMVGRWLWTRRR